MLTVRTTLLAAVVATVLLGGRVGARAAEPAAPAKAAAPIERTLLRELIGWAAEYRERPLPPPDEVPALEALAEEELTRTVCPTLAEYACKGLMAAYEPAKRRIVYRDTLDMRRPLDRSFIVHELVHWLQHREGQATAGAGCFAVIAAEREAYAAQNRYLHHYKVGNRMGGLLRFVGCPPDDNEREPLVRPSRSGRPAQP